METKPKPEKPKQDKSKLHNIVHSLLLQNGWAGREAPSDCWVAFPPVLGSISLMEQRHPCREATTMATATVVEQALTITSVCTHLLTCQN